METVFATILRLLPYLSGLFFVLVLVGGILRIVELIASSAKIRHYARSLRTVDYRRFQDSEHIMPVSLIVSAAEETQSLTGIVENLLSLEFKQFEVILVADSTQEKYWEDLSKQYSLLPFRQPYKKTLKSGEIEGVYRSAKDVRLVVLDQKGGSRAEALNAGVNVSSYPIVAIISPELRLTKDALLKAVYAFVSDPNCVYIGAFPRIGDGVEEDQASKLPILAELQHIERLRMLFTHQSGYAKLGMYLPLQNTFGAFLKSALLETGGFSGTTKAEHADLLLRIHARFQKEKKAYSARLLPEAICREIPQKSLKAVCAERRDAEADMRVVLRRNRAQAKRMNAVSYTRFAETGWPLIELFGVLVVLLSAALGVLSPWFLASYLLLLALLGALQSIAAVLLEENAFQRQTDTGLLLRRYVLAIVENFGYRARVSLAKIFAHRK